MSEMLTKQALELAYYVSPEYVNKLTTRIRELEAGLRSVIGQTDDCEADNTYYGGVWREVNFTARTALKEQSDE